ncbi:MAG: amino acid transporter permease [Microvirga sp.]|jgi:glutamate/aspartate transport system permease protein|nr:amino acid transporter permease [Microvirga sp.]
MQYNWNWGVLFQEPYYGWLLSGLRWTVLVTLGAWTIALMLGTAVGIARTWPNRAVRTLGAAYVEIFRNVPVLLQLFLWFYVLPELVPDGLGRWLKRDLPLPEFWTAVLCLGFYAASRVAEQVRSGIEALSRGQLQAALASGLTLPQAYRLVLLPIGFRLIVPPLTSEFLSIVRTSSVALTIGLLELTAQSRQIENYTFQGFESFAAATALYFGIALAATLLMHLIERRTAIAGMVGKGSLGGV